MSDYATMTLAELEAQLRSNADAGRLNPPDLYDWVGRKRRADYEDRQVAKAVDDERAGRSCAEGAVAYGEDARKMIESDLTRDRQDHRIGFFEAQGLIRLYARIAFRLAALALDDEARLIAGVLLDKGPDVLVLKTPDELTPEERREFRQYLADRRAEVDADERREEGRQR
jgi:hypothetical protein